MGKQPQTFDLPLGVKNAAYISGSPLAMFPGNSLILPNLRLWYIVPYRRFSAWRHMPPASISSLQPPPFI